jgi:hypothetical protein
MNKLIPISMLFLFAACGADIESNSELEDSKETEPNVMIMDSSEELANDMVNEEEYIPENTDGIWQIDDYAEMVIGAKIFQSSDEIPLQERASSHWYEEIDLKGGYARVTGAFEGWYEFVIWRMADGNDLLGSMSAGCGPVCSYDFDFQIMNEGKKVGDGFSVIPVDEINKQRDLLKPKIIDKYGEPEYPDYVFYYNLPQKGTAMDVYLVIGADDMTVKVCEMSWNKKEFTIEKLYNEVEQVN